MKSPRTLLTLAVALTLALDSCGGATSPEDDLASARARWTRRAPPAYTFTMYRSCECLPDMSGPVVVTVRDRVVESRYYTSSGAAVPAPYAPLFPAVEGLFALIETAIRDGTSPLEVQYDRVLGYPRRIQLGNPDVDAPVYHVTELRPR